MSYRCYRLVGRPVKAGSDQTVTMETTHSSLPSHSILAETLFVFPTSPDTSIRLTALSDSDAPLLISAMVMWTSRSGQN